ncbi:hypothetical protein CAOG_003805 [Capsaspora owczarzaki ATCC 30864]|uniref:Shwachman-Bodian-Diamond syndrome protein n=3 Tax=Capsaspora owczarzaki TaxID=192875 RepID=A0A0D2WPZ7_CAPO3|nr:hypothetical protein CAOG_003805 [Capsaspora owczarzaki ATCC 30864]
MSAGSDHQLVKYKTGKYAFEVACRPGNVMKWRKGELGWSDVLLVDVVFKQFSKGERANAADLAGAFGTEDNDACLKVICEKGQVAETAAERKEKTDKRRAEIVSYIHKYYVNPTNNLPHPVTRIELALGEMKPRIDPEVPADRQAHDIIKKMVEIIPLKKMEMEGTLFIPHKHLGSAMTVVHKWVQKKGETYNGEGCTMEISVVPGDYDSFIADINKATKGEFQFEVFGASALAANDGGEAAAKKGKGKGRAK